MADSFEKDIRDALKKELSSIKASDDLVKRTLDKCQNEILQRNLNHKKNRTTVIQSVMPWVYRLAAPLVAGVLVLVLALNGNFILMNDRTAEAAPQAASVPSGAAADTSGETGNGGESSEQSAVNSEEKSKESPQQNSDMAITFFHTAPSENEGSDSNANAEAPTPKPDARSGAGASESSDDGGINDSTDQFAAVSIKKLDSSANSPKNLIKLDKAERSNLFDSITNRYNSAKETNLSPDHAGATYIYAVADGGVDADMLNDAKSYNDILGDSGYWLFPLKDSQHKIEALLAVNVISDQTPEMSVSSSDLICAYEGKKYLVSADTKPGAEENILDMMLHSEKIVELVKAKGYKTVSEPVVADINYGRDFLAFVTADGKELAIPFLTDESLLGVENGTIYNRDEMFRVISGSIQN